MHTPSVCLPPAPVAHAHALPPAAALHRGSQAPPQLSQCRQRPGQAPSQHPLRQRQLQLLLNYHHPGLPVCTMRPQLSHAGAAAAGLPQVPAPLHTPQHSAMQVQLPGSNKLADVLAVFSMMSRSRLATFLQSSERSKHGASAHASIWPTAAQHATHGRHSLCSPGSIVIVLTRVDPAGCCCIECPLTRAAWLLSHAACCGLTVVQAGALSRLLGCMHASET